MGFAEVQLRQVAAKTDVDGRGGSLWVDLKLRSAHLDAGLEGEGLGLGSFRGRWVGWEVVREDNLYIIYRKIKN